MFPKQPQTSRLDNELKEFTTHTQAEAAAAVNAADPPLTLLSEDRPLPAPYELDNQMDATEDLVIQDPEASGVMLSGVRTKMLGSGRARWAQFLRLVRVQNNPRPYLSGKKPYN